MLSGALSDKDREQSDNMTMRVLVADDDRVGATLLARSLNRWGFEVAVAHDGDHAWDIIRQDDAPAMAVLDWEMPGSDGPELCRRIRADAMRSHMYVLLLTSRESKADVVAGLDAGADDYLIKPFDPEELRARVHVGMRVLGLQERLAERVRALQDALSKVKHLNGLLPICAYCKRVRTDQNYWEQVEHYMADHSDVQFSHGICPACYVGVVEELDRLKSPE